MSWNCVLCEISFITLAVLLTHLSRVHASDDNFTTKCCLNGCSKVYRKANSFAKHVRSCHIQFLHCRSPLETGGHLEIFLQEPQEHRGKNAHFDETPGYEVETHRGPDGGSGSDIEREESADMETSECLGYGDGNEGATSHDTMQNVNSQLLQLENEDIRDITKKYLIKIKEQNKLSSKCAEEITAVTKNYIKSAINTLKRKIDTCLNDAALDTQELSGYNDIFEDMTVQLDSEIHSFDIQNSDMDLPFVKPQVQTLGTHKALKKVGGKKKKIVDVEDNFYYIPLLETLNIQLSSAKIMEMVLGGFNVNTADAMPKLLCDFCDGNFVKSHELFSCDETALRLIFYFDDVNLNNPMTNKTHKLTFFYYQIANIKHQYRSKLKSIHLLAICRTSLVKTYGINEIFKPLVNELKLLADDYGYPFHLFNGTVYLRGAVLAFLADTPASQLAGGFKEGVGGAYRKCRKCMATYDLMQEHFCEEDFTLRDQDMHEEHLNDIENAPSEMLRKFYSKQYGVNFKTELMKAPFFDVCSQLPQDIMHIFLEGILAYEIKYLLKYYITNNLVSLKDLNQAIKNFPFGYSQVKDRPYPIKETDIERSSTTNLGQTACRMWLMASVLPLILSDWVSTDDYYWKCLSSLIEIMGISFSTQITVGTTVYLKTAIKEHLVLFKELYQAPIIPKQHYLVHLPSQILEFGPLVRTWCLRHEGKHSFFKDLACKVKNYKNLPYTLAMQHQKIACADAIALDKDIDTSPLFQKEEFVLGRKIEVIGEERQSAKSSIENAVSCQLQDQKIYRCNSLTVSGTLYTPGKNTYLHMGNTQTGHPEIGRLMKIWHVPGNGTFLCLLKMKLIALHTHLNSLELEEPSVVTYDIITCSSLTSHQVLHCYEKNHKFFLYLKQYIFYDL